MHLHFIGIGGIGMSGLAAAFRDMGYKITGSDRGAANPENSHIITPLKIIISWYCKNMYLVIQLSIEVMLWQ